MKSGVPWQVKGVGRHAQETAREAARRSGLSVGEWLDSVILDSALHEGVEPMDLANRDLAHRHYDRPSVDLESDRPGDVPARSAEPRSVAWAHYDHDFGRGPTPIARARHRDDAEHIAPDEGIRSGHRDDGNGYPRRPMFHD